MFVHLLTTASFKECDNSGLLSATIFISSHAVKAICIDFGSITNGYRQISGNYEGDVVTFFCGDGYTLVGVPEATCLSDGQWSASWPTCIKSEQRVHMFE